MTDLGSDDGGPVLGILAVYSEVDVIGRHEDAVGVFEAAGGDGVDPDEVLGGEESTGFRGGADKVGDDVVALVAEFLGEGGHAAGLALAAFGGEVPVIGGLADLIGVEALSLQEGSDGIGEGGLAGAGETHNEDDHGARLAVLG